MGAHLEPMEISLTTLRNVARRAIWGWIAFGVGLVIVGLRWSLLLRYGNEVPYWDEWPAEAMNLFKPWTEMRLDWAQIFAPHNEHRIALTRLWDLSFFSLNGRWDPLAIQALNAIVAGINIGLLTWLAGRSVTRLKALWIVVAASLAFIVPFAYSNLLIAFQSQFFFLLLLGIVAISLWSRERTTWFLIASGLFCAVLALFSVGSGLLVAVTLAVAAAWRGWHESRDRWNWRLGVSLAAGVVTAGWLTRVASLQTTDASQVFAAAGRYLAWPAGNLVTLIADWPSSSRYLPAAVATWPSAETAWIPAIAGFLARHPWSEVSLNWLLGLCLNAPCLWLLWRAFRHGPTAVPRFPALMSVWFFLNIAAMAVARSGDRLVPPRYQDILALGIFLNITALASARPLSLSTETIVAHYHRGLRTWRRVRRGLLAAYAILLLGSISVTAIGIFRVQLPRKRAEGTAATMLIQQYLADGDPRVFLNQPTNHVPWPTGETELPKVLSDPTVKTFLPVALYPSEARPEYPWLSRVARAALSLSWVLLIAGLLSVGWGIFLARIRNNEDAFVLAVGIPGSPPALSLKAGTPARSAVAGK